MRAALDKQWGRMKPVGHQLDMPAFNVENIILPALAIGAKVVSNVAWFIMWVQAVEIFPTCVRVSGMNFAAIVATVLTMCVPYVVLLVSFLVLIL